MRLRQRLEEGGDKDKEREAYKMSLAKNEYPESCNYGRRKSLRRRSERRENMTV